jgi:serine/threonine protein kinase
MNKNGSNGNGKPVWWNIDAAPFTDDDSPGERLLTKIYEPKITEVKPVAMPNVRAKPLSPDFIKKFEPQSYAKDAPAKKVLRAAAKDNFILKDFVETGAKTDIQKLINAFEPVNVGTGETIVEQGTQGDHFYVVESGDVELVDDNDGKTVVGTVKAGSTFGDRNLLFQSPWKCSVRAAATSRDPVRVMRLSTTQYRGIMATTEEATTKRKRAEGEKKKAATAGANNQPDYPSSATDDWVGNSQDMALINSIKQALDKLSEIDLERIKVLGEGQFGEVWLVGAKLPGISPPKGKRQHEFALKVQNLSESEDDRQDEEQMIHGEIAVMQALSHPFMTTLYKAYYNEPESIDMLLGLIPGGELWDVIHVENKDTGEWQSGIPETHAQFYTAVVADTLSWMHNKGYVYRDLKPENIMIDAQGYPLIIDLGFTKNIEGQTFTFCGTPNYVSPEIIKNAGHDGSADWWAFGVVLYEAICGDNPFYTDEMEDDQMALFAAICDSKPQPLQDGFSRSVVNLIDHLLIKDQFKRLGSGKGKGKDVLNHPFFSGLSLKRLRRKQVRAPWLPGEDKGASCKRFEASIEKEKEQKKREDVRSAALNDDREKKDLELERRREEEIRRLEKEEERRRIEEEDRRWAQAEIQRQLEEDEAERRHVAAQRERQQEEEDRKLRELEEEARIKREEEERLRKEKEDAKREKQKSIDKSQRSRLLAEKRLEIKRLQFEEAEKQRRLAEKRLEVERYRRHQAEEDAARRIAEEKEENRVTASKAEARRLSEEEQRKIEVEETKREAAARAEAERLAEEERRKNEEEEAKREAAARAEAERLAEEERRKNEEEEAKREAAAKAEVERLAEEERRKNEEEEAKREAAAKAERQAEKRRLRVEKEAAQRAAAAEAARLAEEERLQAEAEKAEQAAAKRAEDERLQTEAEEARVLAAKAEAEAARLAEEERERKEAEETAQLLAEQQKKAKEARARREEGRLLKERQRKEEAERQRIRKEKKEQLRLEVERQQREDDARKEKNRQEQEEIVQAKSSNENTFSNATCSNDDDSISDIAALIEESTFASTDIAIGSGVNGARAQREARMRQSNAKSSTARNPKKLNHSWDGAFESPTGRRYRASDVGSIEDGLVAKILDSHGKTVSPGSRYSPRVQEELNKSIGKGLVAERLAKAKQAQKDAGVPSMFSFTL